MLHAPKQTTHHCTLLPSIIAPTYHYIYICSILLLSPSSPSSRCRPYHVNHFRGGWRDFASEFVVFFQRSDPLLGCHIVLVCVSHQCPPRTEQRSRPIQQRAGHRHLSVWLQATNTITCHQSNGVLREANSYLCERYLGFGKFSYGFSDTQ